MYQNLPRYNPMYGDRYGFRTKFAPPVAPPNAGPGSVGYDVPQYQHIQPYTTPQSLQQTQPQQPQGFTDHDPWMDHGGQDDFSGAAGYNHPGNVPEYDFFGESATSGYSSGGLGLSGLGDTVSSGISTAVDMAIPDTPLGIAGTVAGLALGVPGLGLLGDAISGSGEPSHAENVENALANPADSTPTDTGSQTGAEAGISDHGYGGGGGGYGGLGGHSGGVGVAGHASGGSGTAGGHTGGMASNNPADHGIASPADIDHGGGGGFGGGSSGHGVSGSTSAAHGGGTSSANPADIEGGHHGGGGGGGGGGGK